MALPILAAAVPTLTGILADVFDGLSEEKKTQAQQAMAMLELARSEAEGQRNTNIAEAGHASLFVSGWRPFIGWVCGITLLYGFILQPLLSWSLSLGGVSLPLPEFPMEYLLELLFGMLGISTLRSLEKFKGVAR